MTELQTDNAMTGSTSYTLGPQRSKDGVFAEIDHIDRTVMIGVDANAMEVLTPAEALGLLDVLTHERERLQQWAREEAG